MVAGRPTPVRCELSPSLLAGTLKHAYERERRKMDYQAAFSGLDDAEVQDRLPKLVGKDGVHRARIDLHKTHEGEKGLTFIAECTILASNNSDVEVGERFSIAIGGLKEATKWKREKALGRLKAHLAAVYQLPSDSKQSWIGLAQFACEQGITKGGTFLVQTSTTRKQDEETGKVSEYVEYVYQVDVESPIRQHPALAAFYQGQVA